MSEYVLTMETIRTAAAQTIHHETGLGFEEALASVDAALAAHDRAVKVEALREAGDRYELVFEFHHVAQWLRDRADLIEGATE